MTDAPKGFIALRSLKQGPPDPTQALAEIRTIYFKTTKKTIDNDLAHAIELLTSLPDEETREKARVYMDGLSTMRSEWAAEKAPARGRPAPKGGNTRTASRRPPDGQKRR